MPRVNTKTKNRAGKPYSCERCSDQIVPGEKYHEWTFRYGGTHRQHEKHGFPKASQLTQSKMSAVYSAVEGAEEDINAAQEPADIAQALETCADEVGTVQDEYQEGLDNLPDGLRDAGGPNGETQERIDSLESFRDNLQSEASDIENSEYDEGEHQTKEDWIESLRDQARNALEELAE